MLPVVWSEEAFGDLDAIADYISRDNPSAADRIVDRLFEAAASLGAHPNLYRSGRVPGTRELVVLPNYILVYRVGDNAVRILAVVHASRRYPPIA
jgi:toxin ParE1/3/4